MFFYFNYDININFYTNKQTNFKMTIASDLGLIF